MSSLHVRPRFQQILPLSPEHTRAAITSAIEESEARCNVKSFSGFINIRIIEEDRHFWSPRLNLSLDETDEGHTRISGIYGPNANVWGIFLYSYLFAGFLGLVATIMGISQWAIGHKPTWFWLGLVGLVALIAIRLLAQFGKRVAKEETLLLHHIYEDAVGQVVEVE